MDIKRQTKRKKVMQKKEDKQIDRQNKSRQKKEDRHTKRKMTDS